MKYKITTQPGITVVFLQGSIDEQIAGPLTEIRKQVRSPQLVFQCEGVDLINSIGISTWLNQLATFDGIEVSYSHMPYAFASLCRVIPMLAAGKKILSFYARYYCESCDEEYLQMRLVERQDALALGSLPKASCERCKSPMPVDPNDEDYVQLFQP